ncbi:MAG: glycosyltransferase family 4 protein [Candidatus Omnitrophota bacterium]
MGRRKKQTVNILMVHPHDLFDSSEPWTIRIKNIAREFIRNGHKVKLCYFPLAMHEKKAQTEPLVELITLDRTPSPYSFIVNTLVLTRLCRWADVVHFQKCHHYAAVPAVVAAYLSAKPLHYDWDDWEEKIWYESCGRGLHSRFIGRSFQILERWLPVLADSVSCASSHLKDLTRQYGVKDEYIFDSPVGADLQRFKPGLYGGWVREKYDIRGPLVLYVGQLHGAQYVDLFLRAANIVGHEFPAVTFMVAGEGFLEGTLKRLAADLGIGNKVIFTGAVPHQEIPSYIAAASICVAPFRDTQVTRCKSPLKIVEYLASGKPVVASNVGEVRKMVGGVGILVKPGEQHPLAEGILKLLKHETLREKISRLSRQRIENKYTWERTAASILSAYNKITKTANRQPLTENPRDEEKF